MKVILPTLGTKGDLLPFLTLARELKSRGYGVMILSAEPYRAMCEAAGAEFGSIQSTEVFERLLQHPDAWKPLRGLKLYIENCSVATARSTFAAIEAEARKQDCVLVTNHMVAGSFIAAEKLNLPIASVALQPYAYMSRQDPARETNLLNFLLRAMGLRLRTKVLGLVERYFDSLFSPLEQIRDELRMPARRGFLAHERYRANLLLGLWPEWFGPYKSDWPSRALLTGFVDAESAPADWQERLGLNEFLKSRPVMFAMGSDMMQNFEKNRDVFSRACGRLGRKGLMISPVVKDLVKVSDDFWVIGSAPFAQLFPFASAVVNHGGIGTLGKVFAAGVPSVTLPMAHDQFDNAYQVERMGAGVTLAHASLNVMDLTKALERVLHSLEVARACDGLKVRSRNESGVKTAADLIEAKLLKRRMLRLAEAR